MIERAASRLFPGLLPGIPSIRHQIDPSVRGLGIVPAATGALDDIGRGIQLTATLRAEQQINEELTGHDSAAELPDEDRQGIVSLHLDAR